MQQSQSCLPQRNVVPSIINPPARLCARPHPTRPPSKVLGSRCVCPASGSQAMGPIHADIARILYNQTSISGVVDQLGRQIATDYANRQPLVLGTLCGAFMFMADLVRSIEPTPSGLEMDFVRISSYVGTQSSGQTGLAMQSRLPVKGRHVLVVEDIVDTGRTLKSLISSIHQQGAASVKIATLLNKQARRVVDVQADYIGFECPDEFVVGYGLDFEHKYRSLPYVGVLHPKCYESTPE